METSGTIELGEDYMKRTRFTEGQIVTILKEADAGIPVEELSREYGFSKSTFYKWKAKYSGMEIPGHFEG